MRKWWAWYPVKTTQGQWAWLKHVHREWNNDLNHWGYGGYSGTDGGWEYHKIK